MKSTKNANGKRPAEAQEIIAPRRFKLSFGPCVGITADFIYSETFTVHVDVLRNRSAYWCNLIPEPKADEKPGQASIIESANTLRIYLEWAYETKYDIAILVQESYDKMLPRPPHASHHQPRSWTALSLVHLWCFADRVQDPQCKNAIIDSLILHQYWDVVIGDETIYITIYQTVLGSGLRKWLVRSNLPSLTPDSFNQFTSNMPPEMFRDVFKAFVAEKGSIGEGRRPKEGNAAMFYE